MVGVGTSTPSDERSGEGARGKGRQHPPPSSPRRGAEGGQGEGEGRQTCAPSTGAATGAPCSIHQDAGQRSALPARNHRVSNFRRSFSSAPYGGAEGGWGKGRQHPPPSSPRRGAEGGWGEGEGRQACAAVPTLQPVPPVPSIKMRARGPRSQHATIA